ncbi:MAG: hypothetical protein ABSH22_19680 [Tepidisphaeraceae bacterium]
MANRLEQFAAWPLSPALLAIAQNELPHPVFRAKCQPIRFDQRQKMFGLRLNEGQVVGPSGKRPAIALWENDFGDGHAFEVMYLERPGDQIEFWNVLYADEIDGPDYELVARSEQGLFFWLFFFLVPACYLQHRTNQGAFDALSAAAKSVHFRYLSDVIRFEEEFGSDERARMLIRQRSVRVTD